MYTPFDWERFDTISNPPLLDCIGPCECSGIRCRHNSDGASAEQPLILTTNVQLATASSNDRHFIAPQNQRIACSKHLLQSSTTHILVIKIAVIPYTGFRNVAILLYYLGVLGKWQTRRILRYSVYLHLLVWSPRGPRLVSDTAPCPRP